MARLRILGKFLGLSVFFPQWILSMSEDHPADGEGGPLRILAVEAARQRGFLRPGVWRVVDGLMISFHF